MLHVTFAFFGDSSMIVRAGHCCVRRLGLGVCYRGRTRGRGGIVEEAAAFCSGEERGGTAIGRDRSIDDKQMEQDWTPCSWVHGEKPTRQTVVRPEMMVNRIGSRTIGTCLSVECE